MKQTSFHLLAAILLLGLLTACGGPDKSIRRGDAALAIGEYWEAANQYKKAYQRTPSTQKDKRGFIAYKMADSYRRYGYTARALGSYRNAVRYGYTDTLTYLYEGDMARVTGDYKGAIRAYQNYLAGHPDDPDALRGLRSAEQAAAYKEKGSPFTVRLDKSFNSNRSDYCAAFLPSDDKGKLFFTSTRNAAVGDELSGITGLKNGDIFMAAKDEKGKWKAVEPIEGDFSTANDEGAPAFSPDGKTMYLTVCTTNPEYPRMAEIYTSQRSDAAWGKPQPLKITADTLSSYAHPAVSPDGRYLYFTSDMPGGFGGTDLWRARLNGGTLGVIENLGETLNTAGNECFPTFRSNGELYFSTDGRDGMGGLDLYQATEDTVLHTWHVVHLPSPMNSYADDFGMAFEGSHYRGYFSSNRTTGGRGWDKLFEFSHPETMLSIKGWVYEQDGYELPAAQIYMVGNDGTNQRFGVKTDGSFEQALTPGVDYLFMATCKGFLNYSCALHADSIENEYQYVQQFPMASLTAPVLVRNVFYEFDKADITADSADALDRLAALLKENTHVTIELAAHCDYRGSDDYNLRLSQRRAESVVRYLTEHGIEAARLTAHGYGVTQPKVVNKKLTETYKFLHEGDTLTTAYIKALPDEAQREVCNSLNRRTEFRVLRTTYGLFDEHGKIKPEALKAITKPKQPAKGDDDADALLDDTGEAVEEILEEDIVE